MDRLPGASQPAKACARPPDAQLATIIAECGRGVEPGERAKRAVDKFEQVAELGFANPHRILQNGLKDRLKLAGRRADDAQHLRDSRPLLARLLKFARLALEFFLQIDNRNTAAARGFRGAARLRLSGLATPCFHRFTA